MIPPELDDLLQHGGELVGQGAVYLRQDPALHTGEDAVPGHAGHQVRVDGVLARPGWSQTDDLGLTACCVAHVQEHPLTPEQGRLHAVLVEARVLPDTPELLSEIQSGSGWMMIDS